MAFGKEREDYWPNYYAFLDIAPDADADTVKRAIRDFRAAVHPDANSRANEEMQTVLARLRKHIDAAEEVLLNDELKAVFDQFREEYPERIATIGRGDGVITIPAGAATLLNPEPMDLDALIRGDLPEPDDAVAVRALQMVGQNAGSSSITAMRAAHKAVPDDPEIKQGFRAALRDELMLMGVRLGGAWQGAGAQEAALGFIKSGGDPYRPAMSITEQIEEVAEEVIPQTVQTRATALLEGSTDKPLLLPAPDGSSTELLKPEDAQLTEIIAIAKERFLSRTKRIKAAADERAKLMTELLGLAETHEFKSDAEDRNHVHIHITADMGEGVQVIATFDVKLSEEGHIIEHNTLDDFAGKSIEDMKAEQSDVNSYSIEYMPEIGEDFGAHVYHILHKYGHLSAEKGREI